MGARHTAIVSVDENGLAFYHSLGKVLFVEASDVLRILGKYPEPEATLTPSREARLNTASNGHSNINADTKWNQQSSSITGMAPLPLGTHPHPTDSYNLIALITTVKLVIVGLKPTPKTWYRRKRVSGEDHYASVVAAKPTTPAIGCLSWYPVVAAVTEDDANTVQAKPIVAPATTLPTLVYSWDTTVRILTIREEKPPPKPKGARVQGQQELGRLVFNEVSSWETEEPVLVLQWLNPRVCIEPSAKVNTG